MLDRSKAFDKVSHYCMFIKLMNRSVPAVLLKVLLDFEFKRSKVKVTARSNKYIGRRSLADLRSVWTYFLMKLITVTHFQVYTILMTFSS